MLLRIAPAALVVGAAAADGGGAHALAFYLLLAAIPAAAVTALERFGALVEGASGFQAFLSGLALALLVLSSSVRSSSVGAVPALAVSALAACVAVLALQGAIEAVRVLERKRVRAVLRQVD
jgi:hypothetical protein